MRSYNDKSPSSQQSKFSSIKGNQSSFSETDQIHKVTTNYGKIAKIQYHQEDIQQSEESSISSHQENIERDSLSSDEEEPKFGLPKKVTIVKQQSSSQEEESQSMDEIQERIKNLEKDLSRRINKHQKESVCSKNNSNTSSAGKIKPMSIKSPPQPPKKPAEQHLKQIQQKIKITRNENPTENIMNVANQNQVKTQQSKKQQQKKSPKRHPKKQITQPQLQKQRKTSKNSNSQIGIKNKQIQDMQKTIENLKSENKKLRDQLYVHKNKKPIQELEKMKELSGSGDAKLTKEIQLLKIIDSLQNKLKKSIHKKLTRNSRVGSTSAALLHKGLPSTLLS